MAVADGNETRFQRLRDYFACQSPDVFTITLSLLEIETILGEPLPLAAKEAKWWVNCGDGSDQPQCHAWNDAGFGVLSVAGPATDSGWIEFERGIHRYPEVFVGSREFGELPQTERFRQLAFGYLQSAKALCIWLGENPRELNWPKASLVCFCHRHAAELFLKACILRVEPIEKCDHDISKLKKQYARLYPGSEFQFRTMYDFSFDDLEKLLGGGPDIEEFERKADQVYRYFSDRQGRSPKGLHMFHVGSWLSILEKLEHYMTRIWDRIQGLEVSKVK